MSAEKLPPLPDRPPEMGFELERSKIDIAIFVATALVAVMLGALIFMVFLLLLRR